MDPVTIGILGAGLLGAMGTHSANSAARKEAERNRQFQREMSDTAHQREVRDMMLAGLNPVLSAGRGASSPSGAQADVRDVGEGASRGLASALSLQQAKANIELTRAQADRERSGAQLQGMQASVLRSKTPLEMALLEGQISVTDLTAQEKKAVLPTLFEAAKAEVESRLSSARAAKARAVLDELEKSRFENISKFEKEIGTKGPALRVLLEVLRTMSPYQR